MAHSLPVADIFRKHIKMNEEYRYRGLFFILMMPSTYIYYLELKTQELPPNYLTESKEYTLGGGGQGCRRYGL